MNTEEIIQALRVKYARPEYVLMPQVRARTGFDARAADAIAMGLYSSRGLELIGFEIKVNRSDWLRELKDHAKADGFVEICDKWFIVAGEKGLVEKSELPIGWGLMEPWGHGLSIKAPSKLEKDPKANRWLLDRKFVAAMVRKFDDAQRNETADRLHLENVRKEEREVGIMAGRKESQHEINRLKDELAGLKMFRDLVGVEIGEYKAHDYAQAFQIFCRIFNVRWQYGSPMAEIKDIGEKMQAIGLEYAELAGRLQILYNNQKTEGQPPPSQTPEAPT